MILSARMAYGNNVIAENALVPGGKLGAPMRRITLSLIIYIAYPPTSCVALLTVKQSRYSALTVWVKMESTATTLRLCSSRMPRKAWPCERLTISSQARAPGRHNISCRCPTFTLLFAWHHTQISSIPAALAWIKSVSCISAMIHLSVRARLLSIRGVTRLSLLVILEHDHDLE